MDLLEKTLSDLSEMKTQTASFPSHFGIVIELRNAINDDRVSVKNVANLIRREPLIASKVVATANSAAMGQHGPILDVETAVTRIGFEAVKRIVIAVTMLQLTRSRDLIPFHSQSRKIWLNSIYCAAAGSVIATNHSKVDPDEAFFTCLVLNIGAFYILHQASKSNILKKSPEAIVALLKKDYLRRTHEVLSFLNVPEQIVDAVNIKDHYPNPKSKALSLKDIVVIASDMAALNYTCCLDTDENTVIDDFAVFIDDIDEIESLFSETRASFQED